MTIKELEMWNYIYDEMTKEAIGDLCYE